MLMFRDERKQVLDVFQEATIDDHRNMDVDKSLSEPWIGATRCAPSNKTPPEGCVLVQKQTDEATVCLATVMVKHVKNVHSAEPSINRLKKNQKLDAARERRSIYSIPDDDLHYEEIVSNARRDIGNKEGLSDALQSHHTSRPERFKLGATQCK